MNAPGHSFGSVFFGGGHPPRSDSPKRRSGSSVTARNVRSVLRGDGLAKVVRCSRPYGQESRENYHARNHYRYTSRSLAVGLFCPALPRRARPSATAPGFGRGGNSPPARASFHLVGPSGLAG